MAHFVISPCNLQCNAQHVMILKVKRAHLHNSYYSTYNSIYPQDTPSSPLKTVLSSLATGPSQHHVTSRTQTDTQAVKIPTRIEEVPFR